MWKSVKLHFSVNTNISIKFLKLHYWDTLKKSGLGTSARLSFNSKKFGSIVCARTTHFDVIMIRKMGFQALT